MNVEWDRANAEYREKHGLWWYEGPMPPEAAIKEGRAEQAAHIRDWDAWFTENYAPQQIAYLIEKGLVSGWPLEFTRLGYRWHREGGLPPPRSNKFWEEIRSPPCAETDS